MTFVYILKSTSSERHYIGSTKSIIRRLHEHHKNKVLSTRNRGPWIIVHIEKYQSLKQARSRELAIKKKKRKTYIEWLVNSNNKQAADVV